MSSGALTEDGRRARDEQLAVVACEGCPRVFTAKARRVREIAAGRAPALCESCRVERAKGGRPAVGQFRDEGRTQLVVDDEMRLFWTERFSLSELVEIASAAWGPPAKWSKEWRRGFVFVGSEARAA